MIRRLIVPAAAAAIGCLAAAPALADGHMERKAPPPRGADELPPETEFFDEFDSNADGVVSQDEFRGSAEAFKLMDKDGDGSITTTELGLPADYRPDPKAKARRDAVRAREERGDGMAQGRKRLERYLRSMDKDEDGTITRQEWTGRKEGFDRLDRNKDGVLDKKDRAAAGRKGDRAAPDPERLKKMFGRMDANGDGKVTSDEIENPARLKRFDANKDGEVTLEEFQQALARAARGANRNRGRGGLNAQKLRRFDRDRDGTVTREEFPGSDAMFKRLDVSGDGVLSKDDFPKKDGAKQRGDKQKRDAPKPVTTESGSLIKTHDKDGDGKLNRAEFQGSQDAWKLLDRNGDGWITPEEAGEAP